MRQERIIQASLFDVFAEHEIGRELKAMSQWLDEHRGLLGLVAGDLRRHGIQETGRHGLPAEAVLRSALLKQQRQLSYEELAFHLEDSASFRAFARLPLSWSPKKSVLHKTISAISAASWETINRTVVSSARQEKLEHGTVVRIDSTVTQALIHAPSDSSLLWDGVRVMTRLLEQAMAIPGAPAIVWRNHRRLAKKRALAIQYSRGKARKAQLYRDLISATRATVAALQHAAQRLTACVSIEAELWRSQLRHYLPLIERVIDQAERRVLAGEAVPAGEKLVSLFEPHADIIVKGGRDVHYGHKLNLTTGRSGLIFDVVIETAVGLGDVTIQARKTYVSLVSPRRTFARVQPTTKTRVDLALRVEGEKPGGRLQPSKIHETMPVQIGLSSPKEVDAGVARWLQRAYRESS